MKGLTWLSPGDADDWFPAVEHALDEPSGLLAAGGELSTRRLLAAYRRGIFPWYSPGQPVLWWSPDPRELLLPGAFRITRSLAKARRNGGFEVRFDTAFERVIDCCAAPRGADAGTWITPRMRAAYVALNAAGYAHSVETWHEGALVGGLYGVALGGAFFGESMWSSRRDASKVALAELVERLFTAGGALLDCQLASAHLRSLGSQPVARRAFIERLDAALALEPPPLWK